MFSRHIALITAAAAALLPLTAHSAAIGFVSSSGVWFSNEPPFSGVATKTYTVVLNNEYRVLTATIAFVEDGKEFARTTVSVPQEEARQISVIWSPTYGKHTIAAKFISATAVDASGATKQLSQSEIDSLAAPISRTLDVDNDSDRDGIGDHDEMSTYGTSPLKSDSDDDGLSDPDEIFKYKTDPNKANTDGDAMNDGDEVRAGRNPLVRDDPAPPPPPPAPPSSTVVTSQPKPQTAPAPSGSVKQPGAPATQSSAPTNTKQPVQQPQKKSVAQKTEPAPEPPLAPAPTAASSSTTTTPEIGAATTTTDQIQIAPDEDDSSPRNWIIVLSVIAGLLACGAGVSAALAWREKNRY